MYENNPNKINFNFVYTQNVCDEVCDEFHCQHYDEFPVKWPVTRKMFPFDDVIMKFHPTGRSRTSGNWIFTISSIY